MVKAKEIREMIVRIELHSELRSEGDVMNTIILDFESGLHFKKSYPGEKEDLLLKLNVGDEVLAKVTSNNNVVQIDLLNN